MIRFVRASLYERVGLRGSGRGSFRVCLKMMDQHERRVWNGMALKEGLEH